MTDEQIETVRAMIEAGRVCVGWEDPNGPLRRILSIEMRDGETAGVFSDGRYVALDAVDPVSIIAYFRPFAIL